MSSNALRVLAVGYKEIDSVPENPTIEELESNLTFMGLVGMIDPPARRYAMRWLSAGRPALSLL